MFQTNGLDVLQNIPLLVSIGIDPRNYEFIDSSTGPPMRLFVGWTAGSCLMTPASLWSSTTLAHSTSAYMKPTRSYKSTRAEITTSPGLRGSVGIPVSLQQLLKKSLLTSIV